MPIKEQTRAKSLVEELRKIYGGGGVETSTPETEIMSGRVSSEPTITETPEIDPQENLGEISRQFQEQSGIGDVSDIKKNVKDYKTKMDAAFQKLKNTQTDTYNKEYESRELGEKKTRISTLDEEINKAKEIRDSSEDQVRTNRNLSAAGMTGEIDRIRERQNKEINRLIEQRNSIAGEYNDEIAEVGNLVDRTSSDIKNEYTYYLDLLERADSSLSDYQEGILGALKEDRELSQQEIDRDIETDQWERELAQGLQIARIRSQGSGSGPGSGSSLADSIIANPKLFDGLTPTLKSQVIQDISTRGIDTAFLTDDPVTENMRRASTNLLRDAQTALNLMDESRSFDKQSIALSNWRNLRSKVKGTEEFEVERLIQSIKDNIAIDSLLNIKREGSGLGQVPQSQLDMLSGLLGRLEVTRDPQLIRRDIRDVIAIYQEIVDRAGGYGATSPETEELLNREKSTQGQTPSRVITAPDGQQIEIID